jgi:Protein of unknown function (DUF742)
MNTGPDFGTGRFDYREWARDGFGFDTGAHPEADEDQFEYVEHGLANNGESAGVSDLYGSSDAGRSDEYLSYRGPMDEVGNGLFGGPGADLFGARFADSGELGLDRVNGDFAAQRPRHELDQPSSPSLFGSQPVIEPIREDPVIETGSLVRPYTRTGGRTRPDYDLAIEALVETSERGRRQEAAALPEHRSICGLCVETRSVAEVAAHLRLPLGVVRVLIGDMAGLGLVMIHQSGLLVGDRPSLAFLESVLSGLRKL